MKASSMASTTTNVLRTLRDAFANTRVLQLMKTQLKLLPFMFSHSRFEEFMRHPYSHRYVKTALEVKSRKGGAFERALKGNITQIALSQAYLNYLFDKKMRDVIFSRELVELSDLRRTINWYPEARKLSRKIIYHHGPTNSGKTTAALEALKNAKSGVYMAPLRLLAWQTQQKLLPCSLITGQEKQILNSGLTSCTIQTVDLGGEYDVAIIDEIQMLSDPERGWAWTQALLAVKASVIHLCGESRALQLVSKLVEATGDTLEERRYARFSKLQLLHEQFDITDDLKPGDCIIAFGAQRLYTLRDRINRHFSKSGENTVAIIYGRLPPQVRKKQAQLFNEGVLPYLVSTNAIGMGLNLKIKRVIFSEIEKKGQNNSFGIIEPHLIQQIAGRAGRGLDHGYVQAFTKKQFRIIRKALKNVNSTYINLEDESPKDEEEQERDQPKKSGVYNELLGRPLEETERQLRSAGMFIGFNSLERFKVLVESARESQMKLSTVFSKFLQATQIKPEFMIQREDSFVKIADSLEGIGLSLKDLYNFAMSPVDLRKKQLFNYLYQFAHDFAKLSNARLPEAIMRDYENSFERFSTVKSLHELQDLYQVVELYIWLANKYEMAFPQLQEAIWVKEAISGKISKVLNRHNLTEAGSTTEVAA